MYFCSCTGTSSYVEQNSQIGLMGGTYRNNAGKNHHQCQLGWPDNLDRLLEKSLEMKRAAEGLFSGLQQGS